MKGQHERILGREIKGHHNHATKLFRIQIWKNLIEVVTLYPEIFGLV